MHVFMRQGSCVCVCVCVCVLAYMRSVCERAHACMSVHRVCM